MTPPPEVKPADGDLLPAKLTVTRTLASLGRVERMERMEKLRAYLARTAAIFEEMKKEEGVRREMALIGVDEEKLAKTPSGRGYIELAQRYSVIGKIEDAVRLMRMAEDYRAQHPDEGGDSQGSLMSGAITSMMLVEVLQLLSRADKTGELQMESEGVKIQIFLRKGQIVHAESSAYPAGEESFYMSIRLTKGSYKFLETDVAVEATIDSKFDHLIMEAVRLMDESGSSGGEA